MQDTIREWVWRAFLLLGVSGLGLLGCQLSGTECIQASDCSLQQQCLNGWCRPGPASCKPPQSCNETTSSESTSTQDGNAKAEPSGTESNGTESTSETVAVPEPTTDTGEEKANPLDTGNEPANSPEETPDAGEPSSPDTSESLPEAGPEDTPEMTQPEQGPEVVPETQPCPNVWVRTYGDKHDQRSSAIAVDSQGNAWVGGRDNGNLLLHKYDPCGTLRWQLPMKNVRAARVTGIAFPPSQSGVIYGGNLLPPGTIDGFSIKKDKEADSVDFFVSQYATSTAKTQWVNGHGGENYDYLQDLVTDSSGSIYITGQFRGVATFGTLAAKGTGVKPAFVAKLNSQGQFQWVTVFEGKSTGQGSILNSGIGNRLALDGSGNLYVAGYFRMSFSFGTTTFTHTNRGENAFITKLDTNGKVLWVKQWQRLTQGESRAEDIKIDTLGNAYVLGRFSAAMIIGSTTLQNRGKYDMLLVKYDPQGKVLNTYSLGGADNDLGHALTLDSSNNIYIAGRVGSSVKYGTSMLTTAGANSLFVAKLNSQGALQWSYFGGAGENNHIYRLGLGPADTLYLTGEFQRTMVWGNQTYISHGESDIFVARLPRTQPPCPNCIHNPCNTASCRASSLVAVAKTHICGQLGGLFKCWGQNSSGKLGHSGTTPNPTPSSVTLPPGTNYAREVTLGLNFTCAILDNRLPYCWGTNSYGQVGNGSGQQQTIPAPVTLPQGTTVATTIKAGPEHACAVLDDNKTYCWGSNYFKQLGNDKTNGSGQSINIFRTPTPVMFPSSLPKDASTRSLALGARHTCALMTNNKAYCWGNNKDGRLGNGNNQTQKLPTQVMLPQGTSSILQLTAGHEHTCAIMNNGKAYCWGNNTSDQLGDGTGVSSSKPVEVKLPANRLVEAIAAGKSHTCAILSDHKIYCWGSNSYGQLGDGTTTKRLTPTPILLPTGRSFASHLAVYYDITCAIFDREHLYCWGFGVQHGSATPASKSKTPTPTQVTF